MATPAIPNKNTQMRQYDVAAAEAWAEGAIIGLTDGEISELASSDPATFLGFAAHAVPMDPNEIYDGKAMVYCAYPGSTFWMSGTRAPLITDEGKRYGLSLASGVAQVDITETVNVRVFVEHVDLVRDLYEVSVIGHDRQLQPEEES